MRLLKDLQAQAHLPEDDLREPTEAEPEFRDALRAEYEKAVAAELTAAMYETWRDKRVVQIAAEWRPACVFVRFSEDNGLVPGAWPSGPGERLAEAQDRQTRTSGRTRRGTTGTGWRSRSPRWPSPTGRWRGCSIAPTTRCTR
ncbi:hypothetical protein ACF09K_01775 [Streptomyces sp. NPDC014882]|uniref:hypothetical protein n=1 Tax=Streptomyces sp. NPDC014882 TaxID=3364927 RepID=UPI0036FD17CD